MSLYYLYSSLSSELAAYPSGWGGVCRRVRKRRKLQKRVGAWKKLVLLIALLPLNACVVETFSAVSGVSSLGSAYFDYKTAEKSEPNLIVPPIVDYDRTFMAQAAAELEYMKPPCAADEPNSTCSVLGRMILDYGDLRAKINASKIPD